MMEDNKLDELFRKSLEEEEIPFEEAHWRDMKKKLEQDGNRRKDILLWTSLGGAAAMFIMTMAWWFIQTVSIEPVNIVKNEPAVKTESQKTIKTSPLVDRIASGQKQDINKAQTAIRIISRPVPVIKSVQPDQTVSADVPQEAVAFNNTTKENAAVLENSIIIPQATNTSPAEEKNIIALQDDNSVNKKTDSSGIIAVSQGFRPSFILSVTAAPDLSAVNSFTDSKYGLGAGLLATVTLSPKLSITSGVQLARKIYETGYSNYRPVTNYTFPIAPSTVDADCRVLDIPLNLNYTVFNKGNTKIGFSAGASSYFMLEEKYDFKYHYQKPGTRYPKHYEVRNRNQHFMGVGNLAFSYERKLNKNAGISLQPFVKLPLTEIGYGNVKLLSAGVSANLNINISEIIGKKP